MDIGQHGKRERYRLSDHPHAIETNLEFGRGTVLKNEGAPVTVMTAGPILANVMDACRDLPVNLVYFHTLKPIDKALIGQFRDTEILVVHDAHGLYEAISEVPAMRMHYHGLPDEFCGWYGTVHDIRKRIGLDPPSIRAAAQALLDDRMPATLPLARAANVRSGPGRRGPPGNRRCSSSAVCPWSRAADGFIGTHLAKALLDQGGRVRLAVHDHAPIVCDPRAEIVRADLTLQEDCVRAMQGVDLVLHAAGAVSGAGVTAENAMAGIAKNQSDGAGAAGGMAAGVERILIFSSSTVYPASDHPICEDEIGEQPPHSSYLGYGRMRRYFEHLAEFVASRSNLKVALVRPTAVYGPHDDFNPATSHVIPALVRKAVEKLEPFEVWGKRRGDARFPARRGLRARLPAGVGEARRLRPDQYRLRLGRDRPSGGRHHPAGRRARRCDRAFRCLEADRDPGPAGRHLQGEAAARIRAEDFDRGWAARPGSLVCRAVARFRHSPRGRSAQEFAQGVGRPVRRRHSERPPDHLRIGLVQQAAELDPMLLEDLDPAIALQLMQRAVQAFEETADVMAANGQVIDEIGRIVPLVYRLDEHAELGTLGQQEIEEGPERVPKSARGRRRS